MASELQPSRKPLLRLDFCDFWSGFDKLNNFFVDLLSERYQVHLTAQPDLVIGTDKGQHHKLFSCKKVFWTAESVQPDFSRYDYAMTTFALEDSRHIRFPYYAFTLRCESAPLLRNLSRPPALEMAQRPFCSFVISNANPRRTRKRLAFYKLLSQYKHVDSGGRALNNIGRSLGDSPSAKVDFLSGYKFNLCFENKCCQHYTTEKLVDAFLAKTIPIYWGNPLVAEEFNPKAFLCLHDFASESALMERIRELDCDHEAYLAMLAEPPFRDNCANRYMDKRRYLDFFDHVIADKRPPLASRSLSHRLFSRWQLAKADRVPHYQH